MKIENVICTVNNEIMDINDVTTSNNHNQVKANLKCATKGCDAKISFVSGVSGRKDHFRTVKHSEHSPECHFLLSRDLLKRQIERNEKIIVSISNESYRRRALYLYKKRMGLETKKDVNKNGRSYQKGKKTKIIYGGTGILKEIGPSVEDVNKTKHVSSPQILARELNQISAKDEGKFMNLAAFVKSIRKMKNGTFELDLYSNSATATLILTEAFIKGNRDKQISEYLTNLMRVMDTPKETELIVSIYTFCLFNQYEKNKTIIFANDFDKFFVTISGIIARPAKLDLLQATFARRKL